MGFLLEDVTEALDRTSNDIAAAIDILLTMPTHPQRQHSTTAAAAAAAAQTPVAEPTSVGPPVRTLSRSASVPVDPVLLDLNTPTTCMVCFDDVTFSSLQLPASAHPRDWCGHVFHAECWLGYLQARLDDNRVLDIPCQAPGCARLVSAAEIAHFLPAEQHARLLRLQDQALLQLDPAVRWCALPGCAQPIKGWAKPRVSLPRAAASLVASGWFGFGYAHLTASDGAQWKTNAYITAACVGSLIAMFVCLIGCWLVFWKALNKLYESFGRMSQCHSCGYELCFDCSRPFHGRKTCQDAEEDEITKWARNHDTAKCPQCKVTIERNLGCNHMTCTQCRHEFCWLCGAAYNAGHFQLGGCSQFGGVPIVLQTTRVSPVDTFFFIASLPALGGLAHLALQALAGMLHWTPARVTHVAVQLVLVERGMFLALLSIAWMFHRQGAMRIFFRWSMVVQILREGITAAQRVLPRLSKLHSLLDRLIDVGARLPDTAVLLLTPFVPLAVFAGVRFLVGLVPLAFPGVFRSLLLVLYAIFIATMRGRAPPQFKGGVGVFLVLLRVVVGYCLTATWREFFLLDLTSLLALPFAAGVAGLLLLGTAATAAGTLLCTNGLTRGGRDLPDEVVRVVSASSVTTLLVTLQVMNLLGLGLAILDFGFVPSIVCKAIFIGAIGLFFGSVQQRQQNPRVVASSGIFVLGVTLIELLAHVHAVPAVVQHALLCVSVPNLVSALFG